MNKLLAIVIGSPLVAIAIAVMRISQRTIDDAVGQIADGFFVVLVAVAVFVFCLGVAKIIEAWQPKPSHQIAFDHRTQTMIVDAAGRPMELPNGARIVEVQS